MAEWKTRPSGLLVPAVPSTQRANVFGTRGLAIAKAGPPDLYPSRSEACGARRRTMVDHRFAHARGGENQRHRGDLDRNCRP